MIKWFVATKEPADAAYLIQFILAAFGVENRWCVTVEEEVTSGNKSIAAYETVRRGCVEV